MLALLIESALRSLLLGFAVWVGLRMFGVRSPPLQMMAWTVVVAASLAMPMLMRGLTVTVPAAAPQLVKIARVPDALTSPYLQPDVLALPPQVAESGEAPPPGIAPAAGRDGPSVATWWSVATAFYLLVACVMLFRLLLGLVLTWRLRRAAQPIREPWTAGSDVRVSSAVGMPFTFGGTILLPADFAEWSAVKRRAAMSHERSHVARGDFYVLLLARLNRCLFWFSPLSWWLARSLTELAEVLSDDAAIEAIGDRASYAEMLLDVASHVGRLPAALPMARPHTVRLRIERILAATGLPARIGWRKRASFAAALVPVVGICTVTIAPGGNAAQKDDQAPSDPQAYCVNRDADFYPYKGEPCKSGYQLGAGNCRKTDGRMVIVPREQCVAMAGTVELPFEPRLLLPFVR
jgi:hypothetical protein